MFQFSVWRLLTILFLHHFVPSHSLQYIFSNVTLEELQEKSFFSLDLCNASKAFHAVVCIHTDKKISTSQIGIQVDGEYYSMLPVMTHKMPKYPCFQIDSCQLWAARPLCPNDESRVAFYLFGMENVSATVIVKQVDEVVKIGVWRDPYLRLNNLDIVQLENNGREVHCSKLPPPVYITEFKNASAQRRTAPLCSTRYNYLPFMATENRYMLYQYQSEDFMGLTEADLNKSRTARRIAAKCSFVRSTLASFSLPSIHSSLLLPLFIAYAFFFVVDKFHV